MTFRFRIIFFGCSRKGLQSFNDITTPFPFLIHKYLYLLAMRQRLLFTGTTLNEFQTTNMSIKYAVSKYMKLFEYSMRILHNVL